MNERICIMCDPLDDRRPEGVVAFQIESPDGGLSLAYRPATEEELRARRQAEREREAALWRAIAEADAPTQQQQASMRPMIGYYEFRFLICLGVVVWFIIFIGGKEEWEHEIPRSCGSRCAICSTGDRSSLFTRNAAPACYMCKPGFINGGLKCFDDVTDLPPVSTAASLGGTAYLTLIVVAQAVGASYQLLLMFRLAIRRLLSRFDVAILLIALCIEVARMISVDLYMLRDYFNGDPFQVYRVPDNASLSSFSSASSSSSSPLYYVARVGGHPFDATECTTFSTSSPLLDYDVYHGWASGGHPRFSHVGWILGGEFAMVRMRGAQPLSPSLSLSCSPVASFSHLT